MEEIREQSAIMPAHALNPADEIGAMSETDSQNQEGELGKFKSVQALMDAYSSLQSEFTKKCQLLSELKKDKTEENPSDEKVEENLPQENVQPTESEGNLFDDEELTQFLSQFGEVEGYAEEIKSRFQTTVPQNSNPYAVAWAEVLLSHLKDKGAPSDPIINQYVLSNESIRNRVIEDYLSSLKNSQPPIVISSQSGERLSGVLPDNPKTLAEAKRAVEKMFS